VTSFDEFMAIPCCATGSHSVESETDIPPTPVASSAPTTTSTNGKESYGAPPAAPSPAPLPTSIPMIDVAAPKSTVYVEEQDDPSIEIKVGMGCKRKACGIKREIDIALESLIGTCNYHPGVAVFREGSKGYS
jgi:hypothetical protein